MKWREVHLSNLIKSTLCTSYTISAQFITLHRALLTRFIVKDQALVAVFVTLSELQVKTKFPLIRCCKPESKPVFFLVIYSGPFSPLWKEPRNSFILRISKVKSGNSTYLITNTHTPKMSFPFRHYHRNVLVQLSRNNEKTWLLPCNYNLCMQVLNLKGCCCFAALTNNSWSLWEFIGLWPGGRRWAVAFFGTEMWNRSSKA